MDTGTIILLCVLGGIAFVGVVVVLWAVGAYNGLVTLRNRFKNAFSQIDVQLKRRYDLIPNLVETAKAYLKHESGTLEAVIAARNTAVSAQTRVASDPSNGEAMKGLIGAESVLSGTMTKFMALHEAYPDLKGNTTMMQLSEELTSTENKVAFSRQAFNDAVMQYNTAREVFPSSLVAGFGNFQAAVPFEIENATEREAPKVKFS